MSHAIEILINLQHLVSWFIIGCAKQLLYGLWAVVARVLYTLAPGLVDTVQAVLIQVSDLSTGLLLRGVSVAFAVTVLVVAASRWFLYRRRATQPPTARASRQAR